MCAAAAAAKTQIVNPQGQSLEIHSALLEIADIRQQGERNSFATTNSYDDNNHYIFFY